jgi:hypothetical protein
MNLLDMDKDALRLSHADDLPVVLRTEHEEIGDGAREEMLGRLARGEHIEVFLDAVTFRQAPGVRNRKFVRFSEDRLDAIAKTGKGKPFLRDHQQWSMAAVGGVIVASAAREAGKAIEFVQTARLSESWAVRMALMGLMRSFSIGWEPIPLAGKLEAEVLCSVCMAPIRECVWELGHWRGRVVKDQIVEVIFRNAELLECSAVPVPAVREVHPIGVRSALALDGERVQSELAMCGLDIPRPKETRMEHGWILAALGLPSGGEQEILAAIKSREEERARNRAEIAQLRQKGEELEAQLASAKAHADATAKELADKEARVWADELVAAGKLAPAGELYEHWVAQYKADPDKAKRLAAAMPTVTPVGQERQSDRKHAPPASGSMPIKTDGAVDYAALSLQLSPEDKAAAISSGIKPEDYIRFNFDDLATQYGWQQGV